MDNLIFQALSHQNLHQPAWRETGLEPPRQSQTHWRQNELHGTLGSSAPLHPLQPSGKTQQCSTPLPQKKELEQMGRMLCSCAARCGTPQPLPDNAGCPHGHCWLERKQRRRGKSEGSSSELFNTSLYCLCF